MILGEQGQLGKGINSAESLSGEKLLEQIAERIRQGRGVRIKDSRLLYWQISPITVKEQRFRLKCGKLSSLEWRLDNVLHDMSRWKQQIGIGVYALSEPVVYRRSYSGDEGGFRVSGHYYVALTREQYQQVLNHVEWQGIEIIVVPLIETRTDVIVKCAGPETISTLWRAYDYVVAEIERHRNALDEQVRDTIPLSEQSMRTPVYVYRRKPSPEIAKRNDLPPMFHPTAMREFLSKKMLCLAKSAGV